MNDIKLKPCPFCGGEAKLWIQCEDDENKGEELGVVECPHCGITQCVADPVADAVAQWNTREEPNEKAIALALHDGSVWRKEQTCRNMDEGREFTCSECGARYHILSQGEPTEQWAHVRRPGHCPNCGAKVVNKVTAEYAEVDE